MILLKISALLVACIITILSLLPSSSGVEIQVNDKIGHFLAYAVLMINIGLFIKQKCYWMVFVAILGYSCLMELFQSFVPGREVSFYDILANATGGIIGILILLLIKPKILQLLAFLKIVKLGN